MVSSHFAAPEVLASETVGRESRGYDEAKKINGRKRHLVVDTKGLPLFVMVTPADMTDRDAAKEVLPRIFRLRQVSAVSATGRARCARLVSSVDA